jgi:transposase
VLSAGDPVQREQEGSAVIVIGVDAHSQTHTAAAVNRQTGEQLAVKDVIARESGHQALLAWGRGLGDERVWAIEDCRNLSGALEQLLIAAGERVLRVPPKLMAKERKTVRSFGKSDAIDALAVARAVLREPDLPEARPPGPERELRLLSDHRDDLIQEGTRYQRRLRWHLHELDPELAPALRGAAKKRNLDRLSRQLARMGQGAQVRICRELIRRIRELAKRVAELDRELAGLVRDQHTGLLEIPGCGVVTAARILAEVGDATRFATEARLASYAGVAPLDASSGRQQRHRLNRTGNRRLNRAIFTIALTQIRIHQPARDYMTRRLAEGKTHREALRALKRQLIRTIYRTLTGARAPAGLAINPSRT